MSLWKVASSSHHCHDHHHHHLGQVSTLPVFLAASLSSSAFSSSTSRSSSQCGRSAMYETKFKPSDHISKVKQKTLQGQRTENTPANRSEATGSICNQSAKDLECIPLQTIMHHSSDICNSDDDDEEEEEIFFVDETGAYVFTIQSPAPCSCPHMWVFCFVFLLPSCEFFAPALISEFSVLCLCPHLWVFFLYFAPAFICEYFLLLPSYVSSHLQWSKDGDSPRRNFGLPLHSMALSEIQIVQPRS